MFEIEAPFYPIVYVRGYAMTASEQEETFHDAYNGFSATSVAKRQVPPPEYVRADIFEGQLIRLLKLPRKPYIDATNFESSALNFDDQQTLFNPSRSVWICRFYDRDVFEGRTRDITMHAQELQHLVCEVIPRQLASAGVRCGQARDDGSFEVSESYKVNLIAHSMGGLVCRTLIQKLLPAAGQDPNRWVNSLVTMGTPHKGIELGNLPDFLENFATSSLNLLESGMFKEKRMREYLGLKKDQDLNNIGNLFPVKRCLCLIGSDHASYSGVKHVTGNHSDGLVVQSNAYVVSGNPDTDGTYPPDQTAYYANVHKAHSGRNGIVNSYESFENIRRFLFGNFKVDIVLSNLKIKNKPPAGETALYDIEVMLAIKGAQGYLHRREQSPCENAIRLSDPIPERVFLHTLFLNSHLRLDQKKQFLHFMITLRVVERRIKPGFFWDHEYPARPIYTETFEVRLSDSNANGEADFVEYRALSEGVEKWTELKQDNLHLPVSGGGIDATLSFDPRAWP